MHVEKDIPTPSFAASGAVSCSLHCILGWTRRWVNVRAERDICSQSMNGLVMAETGECICMQASRCGGG